MIRRVLLLGGALSFSLVGAFSVAHAATLTVTTLQDEDGENLTSCSLREAIKASGTKLAYGGCKAGQLNFTDTIQLAAGTYTLTRGELVINGNMEILGSYVPDPFSINPFTGTSPSTPAITTIIVAASGSRIFNSSVSGDQLNLSNMILSGGTASDFGGAIRAGGILFLNRVQINGATANKQGGAIYLEGTRSTFTAVGSSFSGNNAPSGAVLSMSCSDNLSPTARQISLTQVSVTGNGLSGTSSVLDFCGAIAATIGASTIAKNAAHTVAVGIDPAGLPPAVIRMSGDINSRLGAVSTLGMISNTLVENDASTVVAYGRTSGLALTNNLLAFNSGGLDCAYTGQNDAKTGLPPKGTLASFNLFSATATPGTAASSKCQLYPDTTTEDSNIYAGSTSVLSDTLNPLGLYGGTDLQGYLPKRATDSLIVNKGASTLTCGELDQRGLNRSNGVKQPTDLTAVVHCDIGAMELSTLTANDDSNSTNASYDKVINVTVSQSDAELLTASQFQTLKENNAIYLAEYKRSFRYRQVVLDVFKNDNKQEVLSGDTSTLDPFTDSTKYTITGTDSADGKIHCEWNPIMKQMLASRTDGATTPGGETYKCDYAIKDLSVGGLTKTATISFTVANIAPIAKDDEITLPFGTKNIVLNLLANDSDDGDGPVGSINYPVGKKPFYEDKRLVDGVTISIPANIRIVKKPTLGHIVAEFEQLCPDNNVNTAATVCYGGKITYVNDNLFSPFNDSFTYQVLDSDLTASNIATVKITNTATTTDKERAGGGSFGLGALLGLVSLMFIRRRMVK